jgi:hypothetical protein
LIEPYVDEEVRVGRARTPGAALLPRRIRRVCVSGNVHQPFRANYEPDGYIKEAYKRARDHKWYMTARMITVHDIYSFDPNAVVSWESFVDIVGRNFKQPKEGLVSTIARRAHVAHHPASDQVPLIDFRFLISMRDSV